MIQENEVITLLLGVGVFIFAIAYRSAWPSLPSAPLFLTSFSILLLAWLLTILEGLFWPDLLNFIEHLCYMVSAGLLAYWCWKFLSPETDAI